ncbi:hypothetical protein FRB90_005296, partial [Tulasnella sp. 427]
FGLSAPPSWGNQSNPEHRPDTEGNRPATATRWDNVRDMSLKARWQTFAAGWSEDSFPLPPHPSISERVPCLFDVAVQTLFSDPEWFCRSVAFLPPYLLCRISRYACVYRPQVFYDQVLVDSYVEEPDGPPDLNSDSDSGEEGTSIPFFELVAGAGGELNYVGDGKSGRPVRRYLEAYGDAVKAGEAADSWDDTPPELLTRGLPNAIQPSLNPLLHLHIADVPVSTFLNLVPLLPPTLVRLSIVSLVQTKDPMQVDAARCLRKISRQLPLLELLDVSYNPWLRLLEQLRSIDWTTVWAALRTLIVRDAFSDETVSAFDRRWGTAFEVLFVEEGDNDEAAPPVIQQASREINGRRRLGAYIKLGY